MTAPARRSGGAHCREALGHVLTALDADVVPTSTLVTKRDFDDAQIVGRLRALVWQRGTRASTPRAQLALRWR